MKYDEFLTEVEHRADLGHEQAEGAIRATLETLGERLPENERKGLAAQLPATLEAYLLHPQSAGQNFSLDDFFKHVSEREGMPLAEATYQARIIIALLSEIVSMGEIEKVRSQLPSDFRQLFEVENEGQVPGQGVIDTGTNEQEATTDQYAQEPANIANMEPSDTYQRLPEHERPKPKGPQPPFISDMGVDVDHPFPPTNLFPEKP